MKALELARILMQSPESDVYIDTSIGNHEPFALQQVRMICGKIMLQSYVIKRGHETVVKGPSGEEYEYL